MLEHRRVTVWGTGALALIVALIAVAFALGGSTPTGSTASNAGGAGTVSGSVAPGAVPLPAVRNGFGKVTSGSSGSTSAADSQPARGASSTGAGTGASNGMAVDVSSGSGLTATRVVKTGDLTLRVDKGQVGATITTLTNLARSLGGYVAQSHMDNVDGAPSGEVTLRVPVGRFETALAEAQRDGHETALTTSARDVTGSYVDLSARAKALERTRQTYLTILGRATTIGQTLSVQQRIEDVQQQIEQLQGQLKVLRNQSADATLTIDVVPVGAAGKTTHHPRTGIGAAWHRSIDRFARGFDAIVGALGPIVLALLVVGALYLIGWVGVRRVRRAAG